MNVLRGKDFLEKIDCHIPMERFGSNYGGWVLAPESMDKDSIVYSFGVGEDISFDLAIIKKFRVEVNAFDPTPKSIEWVKSQELPINFRFYEYGVADYDGEATFYPPENPNHVSHSIVEIDKTKNRTINLKVQRLSTIMKIFGHSYIDVLKMDIEGAEYAVIEDIRLSKILPKQILVEFHHRFPNIGVEKSKDAIRNLRRMGYQLFSISDNGEEYSFILNN